MNVMVIYYSLYGTTYRLARAVVEGVSGVAGAEARLGRVQELLPPDIIDHNEQMRAAAIMQKQVPFARVEELPEYDAVIFGSPVRYGVMAAPMKHFFDRTGELWETGGLEGRIGGVFASGSAAHSGTETTMISMMLPLLHLGMLITGLPRSRAASARPAGSYYGASVIMASDPPKPIPEEALGQARALGEYIARLAR